MRQNSLGGGPIMRLFQVRAREGCAEDLLEKFASTSVDVVRHQPWNEGYFYGRGVVRDDGMVIFASFWKNLEAVKKRFGKDWQKSFLPPGYEALIEDCSVCHIELNSGVRLAMRD